jgi:3-deoxy-D-manno-octulosonic-acid transferase
MARFFYSVIFYLLTPIVLLRLLWRSRLAPAYRRRIGERFGLVPFPSLQQCIWVHTVSVGETIAAEPVIKALINRYPELPVVVTTMTPTGSERVTALFGDQVLHCYAPYDLPGAVTRFVKHCRPRLLVVFETELWPNIVHYAGEHGAAVILANARLSASSARGYQRFALLTAPMLAELSMVAAQTATEGERFVELGLPRERLALTGSIKFDISLPDAITEQAQQLKRQWSDGRLIWLAASTHRGEDQLLLQAHMQVLAKHPGSLLVIVPRHPERFDEVGQLCVEQGFRVARRSKAEIPDEQTRIVLGDTMGELLLLYGIADIAFVGGSLVPNGGHNMLEAAIWGVPVISGPHLFNFKEISNKLIAAGGMIVVEDAEALANRIISCFDQPGQRNQAGQAALAVVNSNRGAIDKLLGLIEQQLP